MDAEIKFSSYTEMQVNKANRIVGVIRRTFSHLKKTLKQLFISLVRPHLEYAITTWSPYFIKDKELIEKNKPIAHIRDLENTVRLRKLAIPIMIYRRTRGDMIEEWKFLNGKYNINTNSWSLTEAEQTQMHHFR